jgi:hypothetical protein
MLGPPARRLLLLSKTCRSPDTAQSIPQSLVTTSTVPIKVCLVMQKVTVLTVGTAAEVIGKVAETTTVIVGSIGVIS